ncbi:hypothetical protein SHPE106448_13260 [Shewanella pealeana]
MFYAKTGNFFTERTAAKSTFKTKIILLIYRLFELYQDFHRRGGVELSHFVLAIKLRLTFKLDFV